jgi:hypothetical protein
MNSQNRKIEMRGIDKATAQLNGEQTLTPSKISSSTLTTFNKEDANFKLGKRP